MGYHSMIDVLFYNCKNKPFCDIRFDESLHFQVQGELRGVSTLQFFNSVLHLFQYLHTILKLIDIFTIIKEPF